VDSQSFIPQGPEGFSHHLCVIGLMEVWNNSVYSNSKKDDWFLGSHQPVLRHYRVVLTKVPLAHLERHKSSLEISGLPSCHPSSALDRYISRFLFSPLNPSTFIEILFQTV
jgi:hypothetical protein